MFFCKRLYTDTSKEDEDGGMDEAIQEESPTSGLDQASEYERISSSEEAVAERETRENQSLKHEEDNQASEAIATRMYLFHVLWI